MALINKVNKAIHCIEIHVKFSWSWISDYGCVCCRRFWKRLRRQQRRKLMAQSRSVTYCLYSVMAPKLAKKNRCLAQMEDIWPRGGSETSCRIPNVQIWNEFHEFCSSAVVEEVRQSLDAALAFGCFVWGRGTCSADRCLKPV